LVVRAKNVLPVAIEATVGRVTALDSAFDKSRQMISAPRIRVTETGGALRYSAPEAKASGRSIRQVGKIRVKYPARSV